ncbi:MAG TPA: metalloregulator ArsR/SmtB family transcription factor [Arachnia sp.]|nr:metalloregulator ArsR/SmtB family transcription factor [Arachnia sp.]
MHADNEIYDVPSEFVDLAAEVLALLSDPTRIRLILALQATDELSVGELAELVGKNPSGVSQHLARLRMARMVTTRQNGTKVLYKLADEHALGVILEAVRQAEHSVAAAGQTPLHHTVGNGEVLQYGADLLSPRRKSADV